MDCEVATQAGGGTGTDTLKARIEHHISACGCDEIGIAAAYVTIAGVREVLGALGGRTMRATRWLVGLDDAISQPGAIDLLAKLPSSTVRVVTFAASGARFHTKLSHLANSASPEQAVMMIGSANLTRAALHENAEAAAFLTSKSVSEAAYLRGAFERVWALGHSPNVTELEAYRARYARAKRVRKLLDKIIGGPAPPPKEILKTDDAALDPSLAETCWIECGAVTAMGRELELKAEQGLFFGLNPTGGAAEHFAFKVSDGSVTTLRLKFQGNHMWRLQLNATVPEVAVGLRPKLPGGGLGRSPYVAVFRRTSKKDTFRLQFLSDTSVEYNKLKDKSKSHGTLGQTTARKFGWC